MQPLSLLRAAARTFLLTRVDMGTAETLVDFWGEHDSEKKEEHAGESVRQNIRAANLERAEQANILERSEKVSVLPEKKTVRARKGKSPGLALTAPTAQNFMVLPLCIKVCLLVGLLEPVGAVVLKGWTGCASLNYCSGHGECITKQRFYSMMNLFKELRSTLQDKHRLQNRYKTRYMFL